ncbi:hypothetical protein TcBrA4_0010950 [Trypanosoma cruzi]|nr:hypothetical protein TcBrA4_0010950 [Trypanosoma cruzi]
MVFSPWTGDVAPLDKIVTLAEKYNANLMVDDSHATGFMGEGGRGTPTLFGVVDKVDILNTTLGKALGGASGGLSSGSKEIVEVQRQKGRPVPVLQPQLRLPPLVGR